MEDVQQTAGTGDLRISMAGTDSCELKESVGGSFFLKPAAWKQAWV